MFSVEFKVVFCDEDDNYEIKTEHGVTIAKSYVDAVTKIENYYGNRIEELYVSLLEENEIYIFEDNIDTKFGILNKFINNRAVR